MRHVPAVRNGPGSVSTDWARFFEGFDLARTRNIPSLPVPISFGNGRGRGARQP
jgi:hypothetical protein